MNYCDPHAAFGEFVEVGSVGIFVSVTAEVGAVIFGHYPEDVWLVLSEG